MKRGKVLELMRRSKQSIKTKLEDKSQDLLNVLQSEITHELSSPCFQSDQTGPPKDFKLEWDAPHAQDIVLRKKCETGEEVAVSALLGSDFTGDDRYPRRVMMKVCIRKPGLSSFLQFHCGVSNGSYGSPEFDILSARYHRSSSFIGSKYYTGPIPSDLDPLLRTTFKEYLMDRGIGESLMNFLLLHMHKKEQNQYINWLQKLKETVS